MLYISAAQAAHRWGLSERSVRNYCAQGRIPGAFLSGRTWNIPADATKPRRVNDSSRVTAAILTALQTEKESRVSGGLYHRVQIDLTYNSNHIEGSRLTHDQTRYIFETNTVGVTEAPINVDDLVETTNHFRCIDFIIERAMAPLTEPLIKKLHVMLKTGTSDSRKDWFAVGDYKRKPNEVGGSATTAPEDVPTAMRDLLQTYSNNPPKSLDDLLDFHVAFERIHPFQDGNGRVGRLILFKECLRFNIVPFIIEDDFKMFYYRGLAEWGRENGYLRDTCLSMQDRFKCILDYFRIRYD